MPDLQHSIPINASPTEVYEAVATEKGFKGWWTADTRADSKARGKAEFGFDDRAMIFRMTIDALEPGKSIRMSCQGDDPEWRGTRLEWNISKDGAGSVLSFIHRDWREMTVFCASCNSTWGELMYRIKAYVEGKNKGADWRRRGR